MANFSPMEFKHGGLTNQTVYNATPASEMEAREQVQGISDELRDYINDTMIGELESTEADNSGADKIGCPQASGAGTQTVLGQIESLKAQLTQATLEGFGSASIQENMLVQGAVTEDKIGVGAVTAQKIAAGSVTEEKIDEGAVTGSKIAVGAVSNENIADGAVQTAKIQDEAVTEQKLSPGAVTRYKIADDAVTQEKILNGAVDTCKLADGAVTHDKISDGEVWESKLGRILNLNFTTGGDKIFYNPSTNQLFLHVEGCTNVQLCPIVFGTSSTPPAGTYPKGTVYLTHEA